MAQRRNVRDIGNVKKRKCGKYAADSLQEKNCIAMLEIFFIFYYLEEDFYVSEDYFYAVALFASQIEDIGRDINCITQPIERRYLRFLDPTLQDNFTINFRFRVKHMTRLMTCLRIPAEFQLDNGSWVNGQEGLLIMLKLHAYPTRLTELEQFFGWEYSRISRIYK